MIRIMFLKRYFVSVLCLLCLSSYGQVNWDELPFKDGEEIKYIIYYNWKFVWVPAGEVKFTVTEDAESLRFDVEGRSFSSYDSFFKVRDFYTSTVDKETLLPKEFKRDILEGNYQRFDSVAFDHCNNYAEEYFGKTRDKARKFEFDIDPLTHDMVSIIYHLRTYPIETYTEKTSIPVKLLFDKEQFNLNVNYVGKEKKKIRDIGKKDCYHFQPDLIEGWVFKEGDVMDIWISDDGKRIPLLIESPISYGSVKAVLSEVKDGKG